MTAEFTKKKHFFAKPDTRGRLIYNNLREKIKNIVQLSVQLKFIAIGPKVDAYVLR